MVLKSEYEYRVAEYEYRVAEYEYRVAEYEYRVAEYEYRVAECEYCFAGYQCESRELLHSAQPLLPDLQNVFLPGGGHRNDGHRATRRTLSCPRISR